MDLWPVDIRRFGQVHRDRNWVITRTLEAYAHHYSMAWPHEELESARPVRTSPLYGRLKEQGAVFGWKLGWERPNWFAPKGVEPKDVYTYGRQNWFPHVGAEHKAGRENGGADRPDLLRQVPDGRQGCRGGACPGSAPTTWR